MAAAGMLWTAAYIIFYLYVRMTSYHVRIPDRTRQEIFFFLDEYLFLWWILGLLIVIFLTGFLMQKRHLKTFRRSLDFLKDFLEHPEKAPEMPSEMEDIYDLLVYFQDKFREATETVRQEQQRKNDMIVYLAHDLKTPITSIRGYLELLEEQPELPDEIREKFIGVAKNKADRLDDLINEFFDVSRFNLSEVTINLQKINLYRLMEQEIFEFQPMLDSKKLICDLQMKEELVVCMDPDKMQRVTDNLLRNAVNYSYSDTTILITGGENEQGYFFQIENEGDTIPEESLQRLFEQFFRMDSARDSGTGGSGVGLAIAQRIIKAHGGSIRVFSFDNRIRFLVEWPKPGSLFGNA